jgi:hypothetical protein
MDNLLPRDGAGIYLCTFDSEISTPISLVAVINDENRHQNIRMVSTVIEQDFYEFVDEERFEKEQRFNSAAPTPLRFRLKKKVPAGHTPPPCRIRSTIFFTSVDGSGVTRQKQRTQNLFIQKK